MTFLNDVIDVVRGELGRERLLGIRFYDDLVDYSLGLEDYKQVARLVGSGRQGRLLQHVARHRAEPA